MVSILVLKSESHFLYRFNSSYEHMADPRSSHLD